MRADPESKMEKKARIQEKSAFFTSTQFTTLQRFSKIYRLYLSLTRNYTRLSEVPWSSSWKRLDFKCTAGKLLHPECSGLFTRKTFSIFNGTRSVELYRDVTYGLALSRKCPSSHVQSRDSEIEWMPMMRSVAIMWGSIEFLGNWPPTPPLSHNFALSVRSVLRLT